jgi:hypothetical protein
VTEADRTIQVQESAIQSLETRLNKLESKVITLELEKDRYSSTTLDPSDRGFGRIDSSLGSFAVTLGEVAAHADGVRVKLQVGNLTTGTVSGGKLKVKWGSRMPKPGGEDWTSKYDSWTKSLLQKEVSFTEELRPGRWNTVSLVLPGLPPEKFGYLEVRMETNQIGLLPPSK